MTRFDNSKEFQCLAENEVIIHNDEPALKAVRNLDVYCKFCGAQHCSITQFKMLSVPPVVSVRPTNITTQENGSVILFCEYVGNPQKLETVVW